uniref:Envelope protein n=1 Tax=Astyanax mexicanus TaxID=7994 RepID=A0A3B1IY47_ASTMX
MARLAYPTGQGTTPGSLCGLCSRSRPTLITTPAPLFPDTDPTGYKCIMELTKQHSPTNCTTLATIYPAISNDTVTGAFSPVKGNNSYYCFNRNHLNPKVILGHVSMDWCNTIYYGSDSVGAWARAGPHIYTARNNFVLLVRMPSDSVGTCAMVRLAAPLILIGQKTSHDTGRSHTRILRSTSPFDLSRGSPTYIDAIGVPRGVPNEYKLADQIAAGFENIPIISTVFPVTPNKNVDRINYVHYNILRLTNVTRDAVEGLSEQLSQTSLMAIQNRIALDMILAERGGVCFRFGDSCCTVIPNNTAPDGSVTRALQELKTLSKEMHEHSGIDNPLEHWMVNVFGQWKNLIMSLMMSLAVFVAILVTCGCCCVPCIRALIVRLITAMIEKRENEKPPPYMMPLLNAEDERVEQV